MTRTLGFLVFSVLALGCSDDEPDAAVACVGTDCVCAVGNSCACSEDCQTSCEGEACSLTCDADAKCNATSTGALAVDCTEMAECKGNGGSASVITCDENTNCDLKAGPNSAAECGGSATCKINLGAGSNIACNDTADCDIRCDQGDCVVSCAETASCTLNCGPIGDEKAGTVCPDGRQICGTDC